MAALVMTGLVGLLTGLVVTCLSGRWLATVPAGTAAGMPAGVRA